MRFATNSGRLASEFDPFSMDVLADMMQIVIFAWGKVKRFTPAQIIKKWNAKGTKGNDVVCPMMPHENWITDRLYGQIWNDPQFHTIPFVVVPQLRLIDIDGNEPGRIDLWFLHRHSQRDYFSFEAKRLHVTYPGGSTKTEYATYTSTAGMGAYVLGQYSAGIPAAGMLSYVMDGDTTKAWEGLNSAIQASEESLLMAPQSGLSASKLNLPLSDSDTKSLLGETIHNRPGSELRLFHLLLPYPNPKPSMSPTENSSEPK